MLSLIHISGILLAGTVFCRYPMEWSPVEALSLIHISTVPERVEKAAKPLFRERSHDGRGSFSCEKVTPSAMKSVISEAHVPGNDGF